MIRLLLLAMGLLYTSLTMYAQIDYNYNVQEYSTENGMPSNGIKGMQWNESSGFLWIATEAGIVRFNGVTFKNFTKENTAFIAAERMLFMVSNNAGKIYAADQSNRILTITEHELLYEPLLNNFTPIATAKLSYLAVSDRFFHFSKTLTTPDKYVIPYDAILPLSNQAAIAIHNGKMVYKTMQKETTTPDFLKSLSVKKSFKIGSHCFICTNENIVYQLDTSNLQLSRIPIVSVLGGTPLNLSEKSVFFWDYTINNPILIDKNNAWEIDFKGGKLIAMPICTAVPANVLIQYAQYSTTKKILFLGTNSKGLITISENRVKPMKKTTLTSTERNAYYNQLALDNGNILTNEGHVLGLSTTISKLPIEGKFNYSTSITNDGTLWYSQNEKNSNTTCLHSFNRYTRKKMVYKKIIANQPMVLQLINGKTVVASEKGMGYLEQDSLQYVRNFVVNGKANYLYDMVELQPNILVLATCQGLLQYKVITNQLDTLFSTANYCVRSLWQYKDYLFFGTYGKGFYVLRNGKITALPLDQNNYLRYVHCFMPDAQGFCWLSTNRGLFKVAINDLIYAADHIGTQVYYHYYGRKDGMQITEMNGGCKPCALQLANQIISFPTMDGLVWVEPDKAKPILPTGAIFIDALFIDGQKWSIDSFTKNKLPYKTEEITVQLGFSAWSNNENIYLEYQLNDTLKWKKIRSTEDATLRFNNLASGNYTLRIRKLNGFGIHNYSYTTLNFTITTPWYKKWGFYLLCSLLLLSLLYAVLEFRTRQLKNRQDTLRKKVAEKTKELQQQNEILEKNNTIKSRLISIISHDIVTPLKFLNVSGKKLLEKRNIMPDAMQEETIKEITNTAQELQLLSTNILNWIKYQNENRRLSKESINLCELVNQVLGVLKSIAKQKGLQLYNAVPEDCQIEQYFEPLKILIYNLVSNAINFSEKGTVYISTQLQGENQVIMVKDEGVGLLPEQIKNIMADQFIISSANVDNRKGNGLGYLIIKDLLKMMDATLHIASEKGLGTQVSIAIPHTTH
jgi:signal transduction histidine kinase